MLIEIYDKRESKGEEEEGKRWQTEKPVQAMPPTN